MKVNYKDDTVLYLRKSRSDPDDESINETLARHQDTLMKLAHRQGLSISKIYQEVETGATLFGRPAMISMLQEINEGKYTAILCMDIDRLGRTSQTDTGIIFDTLKEHDVAIITPNKTYDLNNDFDEQSVDMQAFLARQEYKSIARRLRRGTEKSCEFGYHIGEPPYGYERTYIDKHPTLKPIPDQAENVKMIFDMYVNQRLGSYTIANKLNAMGAKPRKGDAFSRTTVQFILKNPIYIGQIVWNKRRHIKKRNPGDKHKRVLNPREKWIVADGIHQPIISKELFDKAQEIIKLKTHPPLYTGELKNVFSGILFCANCGSAIQRQNMTSKGIAPRYLCPTTGCTSSIWTSVVEDYVISALKHIMSECSQNVKERASAKDNSQYLAYRAALEQVDKNLKTIEAQKEKLYDLLEQGVYDTNTFMERSNVLAEKKSVALEQKEKYTECIGELKNKKDVSEFIPTMQYLLNNYDALSAAEKNELYKKIIRKITYSRTREQKHNEFSANIEFNFDI